MKIYVKPKNYFLQNYIFPVHLQGSSAPIVPDCADEGTVCPTANMGYSCSGSDWLIFFELVNANCEDVADPRDIGCTYLRSGQRADPVELVCSLEEVCSEEGCNGGAFYTVRCNSLENGICDSGTTVSVNCPVAGNEVCENQNPPISDIRLKQNIAATGGAIGGFTEYTWEWNETAKSLNLSHYRTRGVLAQEVLEKKPNAVVFDANIGYYRVNYGAL